MRGQSRNPAGPVTGAPISGSTFSTSSLNNNVVTDIQFGGVPLLLPGSFTMGNNGAITLGTALATTVLHCYVFLLAGDVAAAGPVPASNGFYFGTFSSATVGTVFNNNWNGTGIAPYVAAPTAFVTTGPGARTGDTAAETVLSMTIPVLSASSLILLNWAWQNSNTAGTKTLIVKLGGTTTHSGTSTSVARAAGVFGIQNYQTNRQVSTYMDLTAFTISTAEVFGTIDTTSTSTLSATMQRNTATDNVLMFPPLIQVAN